MSNLNESNAILLPKDNAVIDEQAYVQSKLYYLRMSKIGILLSIPTYILFVIVNYHHTNWPNMMLLWLAAILVNEAVGLALCIRVKDDCTRQEVERAELKQAICHTFVGAAISFAGFFFLLPTASTSQTHYWLAVISCLMSFGSYILCTSYKALIGFLVTVVIFPLAYAIINIESYWWLVGFTSLLGASLYFGLINKKAVLTSIYLNEQVKLSNKKLQSYNRTLKDLATTDSLTGLYNRRHIMEEMHRKIHNYNRHGAVFCIVLMDIDNFKTVNDEYGHQTGDDVLLAVVEQILVSIRREDIAGRYGGEEFMIIQPFSKLSEAHELAKRLQHNMAQASAFEDKFGFPVTASIGIAEIRHSDKESSIIHRADKALYRAKEAGKNRIELEHTESTTLS